VADGFVAFPTSFLSVAAAFAADGSVRLRVNASYAPGAPTTLFSVSGLSATVQPLGSNGSAAGLLTFANQRPFAAAQNCSLSAWLQSADPAFASWPPFQHASLSFVVDARGAVQAPTLGGLPLQLAEGGSLDACQQAHFSAVAMLGAELLGGAAR